MTDAPLTDVEARQRALTDHAATLMVEAAAGTGKTALIAGRIAMMLAAGIAPGSIAAVTFSEYAANELNARVAEYVTDLLDGRIPVPLECVFETPLSHTQRTNLERALDEFDDLTCSTIHAFCQLLLTAHAIDANIDPGARVIDEQEREAVLDLVLDTWLEERLSGVATPDDPIAHMAQHNPRGIVSDLKQIARMRIEHRKAKAPEPDRQARPDLVFAQSVAAFRAWYAGLPQEPRMAEVAAELERLVQFFGAPFEAEPSFAQIWAVSNPPRSKISEVDRDGVSRNLAAPNLKAAYGPTPHDEYKRRFAEVAEHYARLLNHVAARIMYRVSDDLDGLIEAYQSYKRRAAMLDFGDLLWFARDLVRDNEAVRRVTAARFRHILVDEFQDTDPVQAEFLFRIAAEDAHEEWTECAPRAGALFIVGDPKQAIYGFRGGDIATYRRAHAAIMRHWPANVLQVNSNFRSRPAIIEHVNACFEQKFGGQSQPNYVPLVATLDAPEHGLPAAARIEINPGESNVNSHRDEEARIVADLCRRLIGAYPLGDRKLRAGDIALLATQKTELARYEQALLAQGIPFVSQAGKSLFRRQETQDLLALTRTLADARDYLAFGALIRGPLVGLTEAELLDITAALPEEEGRRRFTMFSDPEFVAHPMARDTLLMLQDLSRKARNSTPLLILSEAVERLCIRATLAERGEARGERAWANIETLLERARPYGVSGLRRFARDFQRDWKYGASVMEGRLDAEGDALHIITMHSAKGLQWPVVIPINAATQRRRDVKYVHRPSDDTLHWIIGGVRSPELTTSLEAVEQEQVSEHVRLWYVACTRAEELLILPRLAGAKPASWAALVDLKHATLPAWDTDTLEALPLEPEAERDNEQGASVFAAEQVLIAANAEPVRWSTPSRSDPDRAPFVEVSAAELTDAPTTLPIVGAGFLRGLVMHKLIEELLTGETPEQAESVTAREAPSFSAAPSNLDLADRAEGRLTPRSPLTQRRPELFSPGGRRKRPPFLATKIKKVRRRRPSLCCGSATASALAFAIRSPSRPHGAVRKNDGDEDGYDRKIHQVRRRL